MSQVKWTFGTLTTLTQTLASLANGSGRQATMIENTDNMPAARVYYRIKSGSVAPTAGNTYDVYLLRSSTHESSPAWADDNCGRSDADITIQNAWLLGSIVVTASADTNFYKSFDTTPAGPLGPSFGFALVNRSGQALSTTEADHYKAFAYMVPEL